MMMKWFDCMKSWFRKKPIRRPDAGPICRPIFRKVMNGANTTKKINNR